MKMRWMVCAVLGCVGLIGGRVAKTQADWKEDIGYTALRARIGATLENGAGVVVAISEAEAGATATVPGRYMPDVNHGQFTGKTITNVTDTNGGVSGHATSVARFYFGNVDSIAGGVTQVRAFSAGDWVINRTGAGTATAPPVPDFSIMNASWVDRFNSPTTPADAAIILRHVDYLIDRNETIVIGGTDNMGGLPKLLAPSYNSIIVGRTSGTHAAGMTSFYGVGRNRPDLVAPATSTSVATAMVSSAATVLHQKLAQVELPRSEVVRAVLMAGATKQEFLTWDRNPLRPLDEVFGAGELNVDNSYRILEGGQFAGTANSPLGLVGPNGWDYQTGVGEPIYYEFEVPADACWQDVSIMVCWNANIEDSDPSPVFVPIEQVANLDLRLYDATQNLIDSSEATVGNVEHIYQTQLTPNRYIIEVASDSVAIPNDFGIAWRARVVVLSTGDANGDGFVNNNDIQIFVLALLDPAAYAAAFPGINPDVVLDFSGNGLFGNEDIEGFLAALGL